MPLILGTNSIKDTGYNVANSCRFDDGSTDNLSKSFSASNRRTFTWSAWIKRGDQSANQSLFSARTDSSNYATIRIESNGKFHIFDIATSFQYQVKTDRVLRDNSAWYHLVVAFDSTQGTASNRIKMYVNGQQETSLAESSYPSENYQSFFNNNLTHYVGLGGNLGDAYDGYMAEVVFIDGTALDPTSFGEFDEDSPTIWKPKDVSGLTFGTNGFYLDFENASSLGADVSGNSNNFTVNNLTSVDQSTDTCTNNFATLQPNLGPRYSTQTFSNGNLSVSGGAGFEFHPSTIGMTTGKYYFEAKITTLTNYPSVGIIASHQFETNNQDAQSNSQGYVMHFNGQFNNGGNVDYTGTAMSQGDIIMIAFDSGNGVIWFGLNGTWQRSATQSEIEAGTTTNAIFTNIINAGSDSYHFLVQNYGSAWDSNFGGTQTYTISSGNTDGNGYGNFEYAVPSGYFALCTKNLAEYG
jgi:hypothetical protein